MRYSQHHQSARRIEDSRLYSGELRFGGPERTSVEEIRSENGASSLDQERGAASNRCLWRRGLRPEKASRRGRLGVLESGSEPGAASYRTDLPWALNFQVN